METVTNFRLAAALDYAKRGWKILPIVWPVKTGSDAKCYCPLGVACGNKGKHPLNIRGLTDATDEDGQIREWWSEWPAANIGIRTGAVSGFVVLDEDPKNGGDETLEKIIGEYGPLPMTIRAITGSGGSHTLFRHPGESFPNSVTTPKSSGWLKLQGLDIRGDGGYIVASPSLHATGGRYAWDEGQSPEEVDLFPVPTWMLNRLRARNEKTATGYAEWNSGEKCRHWLGKYLAIAGPGNRSDTCVKLMCQLRDNGITQAEAEQVGKEYAQRVPGNGYTEREAIATARSVYTRLPRQPSTRTAIEPRSAFYVAPNRDIAPVETIAELKQFGADVESGKIRNITLPWPRCSEMAQALLPGTVTTICGDPGAAKTYWLLECLMHWNNVGADAAAFFIEKDKKFYTRRLVGALEGNWDYKTIDWIKLNRPLWDEAVDRHSGILVPIGKSIWSAPRERVTLESLFNWIKQMASAGKEIIAVDPITAASAGVSRWTKDDDFMFAVQQVADIHGCRVILITHSAKGNRKGEATGHDASGGAAYYRFCDSLIWMNRTKNAQRVKFINPFGVEATGSFSHFFTLCKTREGSGQWQEIAMSLAPGGRFVEQGVVLEKYRDFGNESSTLPDEVSQAMEPKMKAREADDMAKRLSLLFVGQFSRPQIETVAALFREMRSSVAIGLIDESFKKSKRIDQQEFMKLCKERI